MHQFAVNARDIALGTILLAAISGFASALTGAALGRFLPTRFAGWVVRAALVATAVVVATAVAVVAAPMDVLDTSAYDVDAEIDIVQAAIDLTTVLSVGIQPFAFSFGLWIGRTLRRGATQTALDE